MTFLADIHTLAYKLHNCFYKIVPEAFQLHFSMCQIQIGVSTTIFYFCGNSVIIGALKISFLKEQQYKNTMGPISL